MLDADKHVYGSQSFSLSGFAIKTLNFDFFSKRNLVNSFKMYM